MALMKDLADYLAPEVERGSFRKVADSIGISKTTVENIVKRKLKRFPEVGTLQKIADYYRLTLPAVVELAGATMGDVDKYARLARELEKSPWIVHRFDELTSLSEQEFNYFLDWVKWRRDQGEPPDQPDPPPTE